MIQERLVFRLHAIQRMFERQIRSEDLVKALADAEIIETYPNDVPYPSCLLLGFVQSRPLHIVVANNDEDRETIVITIYEPDPAKWDLTLRRRKPS